MIRNLKVGQKYSISVRSATVRGGVSDFGAVIRKFTAPPKGMKKILSQGQSFSMGQTGIAEPVHSVSFTHNFWIDTTKVTEKDYISLMTTTYPGFSSTNPINLSNYGDNYPVYAISWCDAALYCNARSKRDGLDTIYQYSSYSGVPGNGCSLTNIAYNSLSANGYHLPTEAQWEFACRAGTTTTYYWGEDTAYSTVGQYECYGYHGSFSPVAQKKPNGFGLYNMLGDAFEYVNDYYHGSYDYYQPADPLGPSDPAPFPMVVIRGTCMSMCGLHACANRNQAAQMYLFDSGECGFRVVYTEKY